MNHYEKLPPIGAATEEEKNLSDFLMEGIAHYVQQRPTDRRVLIAALSKICKIVFCEQTPKSLKDQCKEIDEFGDFLKDYAMRHSGHA